MLNELLLPFVAAPRGGTAQLLLRLLYSPLGHIDPDLRWEWDCCHLTPSSLPAPGGSYTRQYGLRWLEVTHPPPPASVRLPSGGREAERVAKAPPWLFSAESDMSPPAWKLHAQGVRVESRSWGARPPPWVLLHFVCSAWPHSDGRKQALRAWGFWADRAIEAALPEVRQSAQRLRAAMVELARPVRARSLAEVRQWMRVLVGIALRTGRTPVLPYMECAQPLLSARCLWVVHHAEDGAGANRSAAGYRLPGAPSRPPPPRCLLRWPKGCADQLLLPAEARRAAQGSVQLAAPSSTQKLNALLTAHHAQKHRARTRPRLLSLDLGTQPPEAWQESVSSAPFTSFRCAIHTITRCQAVC